MRLDLKELTKRKPVDRSQHYQTKKAEAIRAFDLAYFTDLMSRHKTIKRAAEEAGIERSCLYRHLRRLGLDLLRGLLRMPKADGGLVDGNLGLDGDDGPVRPQANIDEGV